MDGFSVKNVIFRISHKTILPFPSNIMKTCTSFIVITLSYVGGQTGILCVLHTWSRTKVFHPHVHCLVPGGGLTSDGSWMPARNNFLVPVRALTKIFRAKFMRLARKALPEIVFPQSVWKKNWVVYCKAGVKGAENVLKYLARYVHRTAITNNSIISMDNGFVEFRFRDSENGKNRTMKLQAMEFIRRFLQHVLPYGFHKVRYYGLWSPSKRYELNQLRLLLTEQSETLESDLPLFDEYADQKEESRRCPKCGSGTLRIIEFIRPSRMNRKKRAPP